MKTALMLGVVAVVSATFPGLASAQGTYSVSARYANPEQTTTDMARKRGPCGDPWVTIALERVHGRADPAKCNVKLYNNGQWSDYNQLVHAVAKAGGVAGPGGGNAGGPPKPTIDVTQVKYECLSQTSCNLFAKSGEKIGVVAGGQLSVSLPPNMVAAGGGNLVGNDGASMVAAGGGNMVAAGGGNILAAKIERATMVAAGGGNYKLQGVTSLSDLKAKTRGK